LPCRIKQSKSGRLFCSHKCANSFNIKLYRSTKLIKKFCSFCGKALTIHQYRLNVTKSKKVYCNHRCRGLAERKRSTVKCHYCGRQHEINTCYLKNKSGFHWCSKKCQYLDPEYFRLRRRRNQDRTGPERILEKLIIKHNLPYRYTGDGKFWIHNINPDFVDINGAKRAIEVDGCYWHNCPVCYPAQGGYKPNIKRDVRKNKLYETYGWDVIHIWEHDLGRNVDEQAVMGYLE